MFTVTRTSLVHSAKLLGLALLAAALTACAAAATPVVADAAGSAAEKGPGLWNQGKIEAHRRVSLDDAIAAARQAAADLQLQPAGEEKHPDQLKLTYQDARNLKIVITCVRRSPVATQVRVDVGFFGDSGMGELVLRQLMRNLPGPAATEHAPDRK